LTRRREFDPRLTPIYKDNYYWAEPASLGRNTECLISKRGGVPTVGGSERLPREEDWFSRRNIIETYIKCYEYGVSYRNSNCCWGCLY
jgi:hypothetical protein